MQTRPASGSTPDPMSDANLVEAIAVDVISCEGSQALPHLYENAELAYTIGDQVARDVWLDIADVAERLLMDG
jgi:hypothetical protein